MFYHAQTMKDDGSYHILSTIDEDEAREFLQSFVNRPDVNSGVIYKSEDKKIWKLVSMLFVSVIKDSKGTEVEDRIWEYLGDGQFKEIKIK